jgi:hypothetical protein
MPAAPNPLPGALGGTGDQGPDRLLVGDARAGDAGVAAGRARGVLVAEGCPAEARVMVGTGVGTPVADDADGVAAAVLAAGVGRAVGWGTGAGRSGLGNGRTVVGCRAGTNGGVAGTD